MVLYLGGCGVGGSLPLPLPAAGAAHRPLAEPGRWRSKALACGNAPEMRSPLINKVGVPFTPRLSPCFIEARTTDSSCLAMHASSLAMIQLGTLALLTRKLIQRLRCLMHIMRRSGDLCPVRMHIIHKLPVGVAALVREAVRVHCRVHGPGMDFDQWVVLVKNLTSPL